MGIYYYAIDHFRKKYFSAPDNYGDKLPGIFSPDNPFPHMLVMMNCYGFSFEIEEDCSHDIPPSNEYEDITDKVYSQYKEIHSVTGAT